MAIAATATPPDWILGTDAARVLGLNSTRPVRRLAEGGLIAVRQIPGTHPRYRRGDVESIARSAIRTAPEPKANP